jgi:hypothetical protein
MTKRLVHPGAAVAMEAGRRFHEAVERQMGPERSKGHIGFYGGHSHVVAYELFEHEGQVYRAPAANPVALNGLRCGARWQCSRSHFDRHRKEYT